ncbi:MAG: CHASE4 domain-containing protein [Dehalococcoidales bacterium]|nr:CHASE4 domain-containing protein [Dehalococcoidales bacterium]
MVIIVVIAYLLTRTIINNKFLSVESNYTVLSAKRAIYALRDEVYHLSVTGSDWATWDDTYAFVENHNESYIKANLVDPMLVQLNLNLIVIADSSGQIVFAKALDLDEKKQIPLKVEEFLNPGSLLLTHDNPESVTSGIILLPENPMLITSHPILTSMGEGPIRGTLIMGRFLSKAEVTKLEDRVQLPLAIAPLSLVNLPAGFDEQAKHTSSEDDIFVQPLNEKIVAGYVLIKDIYNQPALVLRVDLPRDIYHQGISGANLISLAIITIIALSLLSITWIFDRWVLKRLIKIDDFVKNVGTTPEMALSRLTISGHDELAHLGESINDMLFRLDAAQKQLLKSEQEYRDLFVQSQEHYKAEKGLREQLQQENEKQIEFSRALVHELKTPITPVMAAIELLQEEIHDKQLLRLVQSMDRSASNLNKRIDELLDLARADVNRLELNMGLVNMKALLEEVAQAMTPLAKQNKQVFKIILPDYLPVISGDGGRLRQTVENLLINSLKFTPAGGSITLKATEERDNLIVEIQDTGPGISPEDQKRIFEPYHRRIGDRERLSGLGLGLALARKFVELHGGKIWVSSQKGAGSTFGFSLPLGNTAENQQQNSPGEQS